MVSEVNDYLKNGGTISAFEREKGYGKDTVRKKLNRLGYSYNKTLKQFVTQDVTQKVTQKVTHKIIKNDEVAYPIKSNKKECKKMELADFKKMNTKDQIDFVNQFCDGKRNLKEIEKEHFTFKNIGLYINRYEGFWDGKLKKYIYIKPKQNIFTEEDYAVLQTIINNYKNKQKVNDTEFEGEVVVRSVRTYKNILDNFAKYCKDNNLKQTDALAQALINFMK